MAIVMLGIAALSATALPPASATTVKVLEFTGVAQLSSGVGYPGIGPNGNPDPEKIPCTVGLLPDPGCVTFKVGPKGEPVVNVAPEGNHTSFSLSSDVCVKVSAGSDPAKKFPGPALCTFLAVGAAWGYCGLLTGVGLATIENLGIYHPLKDRVSIEIKFTSVAEYLYLTGGSSATNIHSLMVLEPVPATPGGPSCTTKTASSWLLHGTAVYKDTT